MTQKYDGTNLEHGEGYVGNGGYVLLRKPEHPNANNRGYILAHRFVMSEALDRPLEEGEIVHHQNGDKKDNRLENLQLKTHSEHTEEHWEDGDFEDLRGRTIITCEVCGEERENYASGWCVNCYQRRYYRHQEDSSKHNPENCRWC